MSCQLDDTVTFNIERHCSTGSMVLFMISLKVRLLHKLTILSI